MKLSGRTLLVWGVLLAGVGVTTLLDQPVWRAWHPADEAAKVAFEKRDLVQMLRSVGYVPVWIVVGAVAWLVQSGQRGRMSGRIGIGAWRGWLIPLSAALGGGLAELLKLIVGRERPDEQGAYVWRGLFSGFTNPGNLGMASSHAGVAFGGACMVIALHPRTAWVMVPLAAACAAARVGTGAHFVSDVWVGAMLGYVAAKVIARWTRS